MPLDLIAIRRDLHRNPELAFEEKRTSKIIFDTLLTLGLSPRNCAGTGVVVDIKGEGPGHTVAIRVDIDAL